MPSVRCTGKVGLAKVQLGYVGIPYLATMLLRVEAKLIELKKMAPRKRLRMKG